VNNLCAGSGYKLIQSETAPGQHNYVKDQQVLAGLQPSKGRGPRAATRRDESGRQVHCGFVDDDEQRLLDQRGPGDRHHVALIPEDQRRPVLQGWRGVLRRQRSDIERSASSIGGLQQPGEVGADLRRGRRLDEPAGVLRLDVRVEQLRHRHKAAHSEQTDLRTRSSSSSGKPRFEEVGESSQHRDRKAGAAWRIPAPPAFASSQGLDRERAGFIDNHATRTGARPPHERQRSPTANIARISAAAVDPAMVTSNGPAPELQVTAEPTPETARSRRACSR
jgi:hypothetical protein